jgi:hypothetical protein
MLLPAIRRRPRAGRALGGEGEGTQPTGARLIDLFASGSPASSVALARQQAMNP